MKRAFGMWIGLVALLWAFVGCAGHSALPPTDPSDSAKAPAEVILESFAIDVRELAPFAEALPTDERPEQIADWVVYATAARAGLDAKAFRDAFADRAPLRNTNLDDTINYAYGAGRSLVAGNGRVMLFISAFDHQSRQTIGELADQVRAEQQELPVKFEVYRFASSLADGTVKVERLADIKSQQIFSTEYGYHEATIASVADLEAWLGKVQDLTFMSRADGSLRLGGRARPGGKGSLTLEDVAALYQSERVVSANAAADSARVARVEEITKAQRSVGDALLDHIDQPSATTCRAADRAIAAFATAINETGTKPFSSCSEADPATQSLRQLTEAQRLVAISNAAVEKLVASAGLLPKTSGFSLDPQWEVTRLRTNLRLLASDPKGLVEKAKKAMTSSGEPQPHKTGGNHIALAAQDLVFSHLLSGPAMPARSSAFERGLTATTDELRGADGLLPYVLEFERLKAAERYVDSDWLPFLAFIEADSRVQCARYDGPLHGTEVGMTLFYTDLVAKLWGGLDYRDSAPLVEVPGFRSIPMEEKSRSAEPTRLWFGPANDRITRTGDSLYFAPTAARIYAAGTVSLLPGFETAPDEQMRQVLGWWDRHYASIANHEPQYHRLNQAVKWSVALADLARARALPDLLKVSVRHDLRFDDWLGKHSELRAGKGVQMLPRERWTGREGERECMPRLTSRIFENMSMLGGVSLGSTETLKSLATSTTKLGKSLRRGGLDVAQSSDDVLVAGARSVKVALSESETGVTVAESRLTDSARQAAGSRRTQKVTTSVKRAEDTTYVQTGAGDGAPVTLGFKTSKGDVQVLLAEALTPPRPRSAGDPSEVLRGGNGIRGPPPTSRTTADFEGPERNRKLLQALGDEDGAKKFAAHMGLPPGFGPETPPTATREIPAVPAMLKPQNVDPKTLQTAANGARNGGHTDIYVERGPVMAKYDFDSHPIAALSQYSKLPKVSAAGFDGETIPKSARLVRDGKEYYRVYQSGGVNSSRRVVLVTLDGQANPTAP